MGVHREESDGIEKGNGLASQRVRRGRKTDGPASEQAQDTCSSTLEASMSAALATTLPRGAETWCSLSLFLSTTLQTCAAVDSMRGEWSPGVALAEGAAEEESVEKHLRPRKITPPALSCDDGSVLLSSCARVAPAERVAPADRVTLKLRGKGQGNWTDTEKISCVVKRNRSAVGKTG